MVLPAKRILTSRHRRGTEKRDLSEPKTQNRSGPFVEAIAVISKPGPKTARSPEESSARPQAPAANELHAWAKVTEALANIPRSFLSCAGPDPAASSQDWENGWEDRRRPHPHRGWSPSPSWALHSTQQEPPLPTRLPAKLCKQSSSSGRTGRREGTEQGSSSQHWMWPNGPCLVWTSFLSATSSLIVLQSHRPGWPS